MDWAPFAAALITAVSAVIIAFINKKARAKSKDSVIVQTAQELINAQKEVVNTLFEDYARVVAENKSLEARERTFRLFLLQYADEDCRREFADYEARSNPLRKPIEVAQ